MSRSRIVLAAAVAGLGAIGLVNPVAAQVKPNILVVSASTLWDNNSAGAVSLTNSGSILCCSNSQNQNAAFPTATDQTADDFTVPTGQSWSVSQVNVPGTAFVAGNTPATYNVYVYANSSGKPGSLAFSQTGITPSNSSTNNASPNLALTGLNLTAGTYWVSVQANGSNFRWYWDDTTAPTGSLYNAQFQEPGGYDFSNPNPCATWTARTTCVGDATHADQAFKLLGTLTNSLSQYGLSASSTGTEGVAPTGSGYYLGSFQNSTCNATTQPASDYTGAINWNGTGAGSTAATITSTTTACVFNVYGTYAYYNDGTFHPTVTITESSTGSQLTLSPTLTISEGELTAGAATTGQTCTLFASCSFVAAQFSDSNAYCNQELNPAVYTQYTATVHFGDGTTASSNSAGTGAVQIGQTNNCSFTVSATHTYSSTGPKVVTTTICDEATNCVTTSTSGTTVSAPTVTVGTPTSSPPGNGRLSTFVIRYQHVTPYPHYSNYTVGLTEYHYSTGANIANLNYLDTAHNIYLSYCATHNYSTTQCRAHVLSFTCTAATSTTPAMATVYLAFQLANQSITHYALVTGSTGNNTTPPSFSVTTDNGPGATLTTTPPTTPQPGTVSITC